MGGEQGNDEETGRSNVVRMAQAWAAGEINGAGEDADDEHDEDDPVYLKEKGNEHFKARRYKEARACYSDALEAELARDFASGGAFNSALYCNRAACALQLCDFDAALLDAGKAVQMDKNNSKAYFRKGKAFIGLERFEDALDCLEHAKRLQPEDAALDKLIADCEKRTARGRR